MAIFSRENIKKWFERYDKPTQAQFSNTWDSFIHWLDDIPISKITNLQSILNNKLDSNQFDAHVNDKNNPHHVTVEQVEGAVTIEQHEIEINNRIDGDKQLQEQIDDLHKITAIRGNVDTYAHLLALDKSNIRDGDSYIVEVDETHSDKATIYALSGDEWVYTGEWSTVADLSGYQKTDEKGQPGGYTPLGNDGKVPQQYLPDGIGQDTNLGNTDQQLTAERAINLNDKNLFVKNGDDSIIELSTAGGSYSIQYNLDTILINANTVKGGINFINVDILAGMTNDIQIRFHGPEFQNKFTCIDESGKLLFLSADEFKQRLGI